MVADEILTRLVPQEMPLDVSPVVLGQEIDGLRQRLVRWNRYIRIEFQRATLDGRFPSRYLASCSFIGVGVGYATQLSRSVRGFPVVDGYQFGVFMYFSGMPADLGSPSERSEKGDYFFGFDDFEAPRGLRVPVNFVLVDYLEHLHPKGGALRL